LYFGKIPTELDPEQVYDYLFYLQKSKTPSQTYFKHTVYGLRFLLKSEGLPYEYLRLPSIKHEKKLPVVLSKVEVCSKAQSCSNIKSLLVYFMAGLRCMEARSVRQDLDFDRKQLKVVQGKGKKDRYVPLSIHLIRGLKNTLQLKTKDYLLMVSP
jgi:integrase